MALVFKKPKKEEVKEEIEEIEELKEEKSYNYSEMIATLFHAKTQAHYFYLQTELEVEHTLMNMFYNDLLDLTDKFSKIYLGLGNEIEVYSFKDFENYSDTQQLSDFLDKLLKETSDCSCESKELELVLLQVNQLIYKTKYLLKLK